MEPDLISLRIKPSSGKKRFSLHKETSCRSVMDRPHMATLDIARVTISIGESVSSERSLGSDDCEVT
jgi:hypothetical protein